MSSDTDRIDKLYEMVGEIKAVAIRIEATMAAAPKCADPGACVRVEKALVEQNHRLVYLEAQENKRVGAIAITGLICTFVGAGISLAVSWFHK